MRTFDGVLRCACPPQSYLGQVLKVCLSVRLKRLGYSNLHAHKDYRGKGYLCMPQFSGLVAGLLCSFLLRLGEQGCRVRLRKNVFYMVVVYKYGAFRVSLLPS